MFHCHNSYKNKSKSLVLQQRVDELEQQFSELEKENTDMKKSLNDCHVALIAAKIDPREYDCLEVMLVPLPAQYRF